MSHGTGATAMGRELGIGVAGVAGVAGGSLSQSGDGPSVVTGCERVSARMGGGKPSSKKVMSQ